MNTPHQPPQKPNYIDNETLRARQAVCYDSSGAETKPEGA